MRLRNIDTEYEYTAYLTTEHACSSYGQPAQGVLSFSNSKIGYSAYGGSGRGETAIVREAYG
jgi:hypothetical protein